MLLLLIRETKKSLQINYDLRIKNLIIVCTILAIFLIFSPIQWFGIVLQNTFLGSFLTPDLLEMFSWIFWVFLSLILNMFLLCFFGVFGKGDGKLIQSTFDSFNMTKIGKIIRKIGRFFYNLNPLNDKIR
ncbi:MAG: hypothetical protein ACTSVY_07770 [Candidatus Helarchaeota archaeon]